MGMVAESVLARLHIGRVGKIPYLHANNSLILTKPFTNLIWIIVTDYSIEHTFTIQFHENKSIGVE